MNPIPWYKSQKFYAFVAAEVYILCGWLTTCLTEDRWYWKGLAVSTLLVVGNIVKEWTDPKILAPFDRFNRNNVTPS